MTKKKVLLLGKLPPPYMGPAIATGIILNSDLKNRFELLFLNTKANDSISTLGKWSLGKIFKNISLYFKLIKIIIKKKPDLVLIPISQTTKGFLKDSIYILLAMMLGSKVLVQLRGSNFKTWLFASSGLTNSYVKFVLKKTCGVIVLGNKLKYLFVDYFPAEKIFVVPNGADYTIPVRKRNSDEIKIIYLSNLLASKGIEDVFQAIEILNRTNKNFSVDFIGEWVHEDIKRFCLDLKKKHNLPIRIHTSGVSKEKFNFLAEADIFVFPPRDPEGHPWSIIEAMAAGLPIISTDRGAITESVIDGQNGYIVEPGRPEAIAQKIQTWIDDKNLRKKMGQESRNLYLKNFTEEIMVNNLSKVFNIVTEEKLMESVNIDSEELKRVQDFWNENLCGKQFVDAKFPSKEFFAYYREFRYKKTHHLDTYIDWQSAKGKSVLEIGLGIGADGTRWAEHTAIYTGVDLTTEAVQATKIHFEHLGLKGNIIQGNAEALDLPSNSFDMVYSYGVLHHTTHINKAFKEINRVLKPNGEFIVMLYAKGSFNYWIRIQVYFRMRLLYEILKNKTGGTPKENWALHVKNFKNDGWSYLSWKNFPHHCTDGPGCYIANIYYQSEIKKMLEDAGFRIEKMKKAHFPLGANFPKLERFVARFLGFHQLVWARKK